MRKKEMEKDVGKLGILEFEIPNREKRFQGLVKKMLIGGITEAIFTVTKELFDSQYGFLTDYSISATAKATTFRAFGHKSSIRSFRFLGCDIHFLITE
jgi:hypothetical protein